MPNVKKLPIAPESPPAGRSNSTSRSVPRSLEGWMKHDETRGTPKFLAIEMAHEDLTGSTLW